MHCVTVIPDISFFLFNCEQLWRVALSFNNEYNLCYDLLPLTMNGGREMLHNSIMMRVLLHLNPDFQSSFKRFDSFLN